MSHYISGFKAALRLSQLHLKTNLSLCYSHEACVLHTTEQTHQVGEQENVML